MNKPKLVVTGGSEYNPHPRLVKMNPTLAAKILEDNPINRAVSEARVARYAKSMRDNRWRMNGATIVIAKGGALLDGQHRLWAVIESKQTIEMLVVEGVDPDAFATIDTGRARTASNVFSIAGRTHASTVSAALRWLVWYSTPPATRPASPGHLTITHDEMLELASENEDFTEAASRLSSMRQARKIVTPSVACFVYAVAARENPERAGAWLALVESGEGLDGKHPVLQLRTRLLENRLSQSAKLPLIDVCALTIKSWNYYLTGARRNVLRWMSTEPFPEIATSSGR